MKYDQRITLKNGVAARLRNGVEADGAAVRENFNQVHAETDFMLSYPDENRYNAEQEAQFLKNRAESAREVMILAEIGGEIVGAAGVDEIGKLDKLKHRAEFGIGIRKDYWGLGLGRAMAEACIRCAREAGYEQLELNAIADNERALSLYRSLGFEEFGRNPFGYKSRFSGYQEVVYMLLRL